MEGKDPAGLLVYRVAKSQTCSSRRQQVPPWPYRRCGFPSLHRWQGGRCKDAKRGSRKYQSIRHNLQIDNHSKIDRVHLQNHSKTCFRLIRSRPGFRFTSCVQWCGGIVRALFTGASPRAIGVTGTGGAPLTRGACQTQTGTWPCALASRPSAWRGNPVGTEEGRQHDGQTAMWAEERPGHSTGRGSFARWRGREHLDQAGTDWQAEQRQRGE